MNEFPSYYEFPKANRAAREALFSYLDGQTIYCQSHQDYLKQTGYKGLSNWGISTYSKLYREFRNPFSKGYQWIKIYVDTLYYKEWFEKDFSDMIPYDLLHEKWETYYFYKSGHNLGLRVWEKEGWSSYFGPCHRLAIKQSLRAAAADGRLSDYLAYNEAEKRLSARLGFSGALTIELDFYQREAQKIREHQFRL